MPNLNRLEHLTRTALLTTLVLALALVSALAVTAALAKTYIISINVTDARNVTAPKWIQSDIAKELYTEYLNRVAPWYFTAGKEFRLIIRNVTDVYYPVLEDSTPKFVLASQSVEIEVTTTANRTGGVRFEIKIPDEWENYTAYWLIVLTVKAYGAEWLALNYTTATPIPLWLLLENLTKLNLGAELLVINSTIFGRLLYNLTTNFVIANVTGLKVCVNKTYAQPVNLTAANATLTLHYSKDGVFNGTLRATGNLEGATRQIAASDIVRLRLANFTDVVNYRYAALRLPYVQAFFLAIGALNKTAAVNVTDCEKYTATITLVTPAGETVIYRGTYNETFTEVIYNVTKEHGREYAAKYYCAFGPVYYLTPLFLGIDVEVKTRDLKKYYLTTVKVQKPYSDVYLKIDVVRPVGYGGGVVTVLHVEAKPKSLKNYGVIALFTNATWAYHAGYNTTAVGLYGWAVTALGRTLDLVPVLPVPIIYASVDIEKLVSLFNKRLPDYFVHKLAYKWVIVVGGKKYLIDIGTSTTLVGRTEATVGLRDDYTVEVEGRKPSFEIFDEYDLYIWYKDEEVAELNITALVYRAVEEYISKVEVGGLEVTIPTSLVPIVVYLKKLQPEVNVTEAPNLPPDLAERGLLSAEIERALVASGPYYKFMKVYPVANEDKVVLSQEPYYVYGVKVWPAVVFLPAPEPIKINVTATVSDGKVVVDKVEIAEPAAVFDVYYYKFVVYYSDIPVGVAVLAVGFKVVSSMDELPSWAKDYRAYIETKTGKYIVSVADVVGGFEILDTSSKYLAQYYWNATPRNITVSVTFKPSVQEVKVLAHVCYIGAAVTPVVVYFKTLYDKLISEELPVGVSAFVRVIETVGSKEFVDTISARSVYETVIPVPVEINETGWPELKAAKTQLRFELEYEGYRLTAVNKTTGEPLVLTLEKLMTMKTVYVAFPLVNAIFKVESADNKTLPGFVVEVYSVHTGRKLWMAITNGRGEAYVGLLPANDTVKVVVRTLKPEDDREWFEASVATNKTLAETGNNYAEYAAWLGKSADEDVYTLGTRGPYDAGLVVLSTTVKTPAESGKVVTLRTTVRPLKIYVVYDDAGKYVVLSSTVPVYPCALPGYCAALIYNTTLVVVDTVYRNASRIKPGAENYTADFRVIAITWMKPIFKRYAAVFEEYAEKALENATKFELDRKAWLRWIKDYVANKTFALTAEYFAEHSTDSPLAIFTLPVLAGADLKKYHIARVWLPGQRLHVKIYYMGYEVFNNIIEVPPADKIAVVTPDGELKFVDSLTVYTEAGKAIKVEPGSVVIVADVKPVTFKIVTAVTKKPVEGLYLGLLFADALLRVYESNVTVKMYPVELRVPVLKPFNVTTPVVWVKRGAKINETVKATVNGEELGKTKTVGKVLGAVALVLPNLGAVLMNFTGELRGTEIVGELTKATLALSNVTDETFNITAAMPMNFTVVWRPGAEVVYLRVVPYRDIMAYYKPLVSEYVLHRWPSWQKLTEDEPKKNFTEPDLITPELYKYNISAVYLILDLTGVDSISKLVVKVYARYYNKTLDKEVDVLLVTRNITDVVKRHIGRFTKVIIAIPREVLAALPNKTKVFIGLEAEGLEGEIGVLANFTTGAGLVAENVTEVEVLRNVEYKLNKTKIFRVRPVAEWEPYFGSPMLVLVPVGVNGEVRLVLPMWTVTTAAYGARIARVYIIATNDTPGVPFGEAEPYTLAPGVVPEIRLKRYVIVNLVELPKKAKEVYWTLWPPVNESVSDLLYLVGEKATSTLVYRFAAEPVELVNVSKMPSTVVLPAAIVTYVNVTAETDYPVLAVEAEVSYEPVVKIDGKLVRENETYSKDLALVPTVVKPDETAKVKIGYLAITATAVDYYFNETLRSICGLVMTDYEPVTTYDPTVNLTFKYWPPSYTFYTVEGKAYTVTSEELVQYEVELGSVSKNVSAVTDLSEEDGVVPEIEFEYGTLPLERVFTWSGEAELVNMTVAVFKTRDASLCEPVAISFIGKDGKLVQPLPEGERVVVFWYDSYIKFLRTVCRGVSAATAKASFAAAEEYYWPIVIYDSAISEDVEKLGNATATSTVRTWTYMLKVVVRDKEGRPVPNALVIVKDEPTGGEYFYATAVTGTDGSAVVRDPRTSAAVSIAPPTTYVVAVYVPVKKTDVEVVAVPVAVARQTLQRGSAEPVQVVPVSLGVYKIVLPVQVVLNVPGEKPVPLAGTAVKVTAVVPAEKLRKTALGTYVPTGETVKIRKEVEALTDAEGKVTLGPIYLPARGAVEVNVEVKNATQPLPIELGYEMKFALTPENVTEKPVTVAVPAAKLAVIALSANRVPLGTAATIYVTCRYDGRTIATAAVRGDTVDVVVPLPRAVYEGKKTIECLVAVHAAGTNVTETVTLAGPEAATVKKVEMIVPVAGIVFPGGVFVPMQQLITLLVILLIVIIIIVIGLMEYQHWRRKRLVSIIGAPGPAR